ncbi:MAG: ATP-binding cassette domain-containing protein [Arcanobacterium sp.]|nr:ATP-binding cassette domain-containing protein [Arcanobacterium sp.]
MSLEEHKLIELNKVCFSYLKGEEIFQDFSLKIGKGTHAIVGASGCGKSTLLKLLLGEIKPSSGSINVAGTLVSSLKSYRNIADFRRSKIGYVEQEPRFIDELDALTNVALAAALNSNEIKTAKKNGIRFTEICWGKT